MQFIEPKPSSDIRRIIDISENQIVGFEEFTREWLQTRGEFKKGTNFSAYVLQ
jgi:hypothetical protein